MFHIRSFLKFATIVLTVNIIINGHKGIGSSKFGKYFFTIQTFNSENKHAERKIEQIKNTCCFNTAFFLYTEMFLVL